MSKSGAYGANAQLLGLVETTYGTAPTSNFVKFPAHYYAMQAPQLETAQRLDHAEQFFKNLRADIRYGGNRAFYAIGSDYVQMPPFEFFKDPESFYATQLHECTHWTRHPTRLDRDFGRKKWGDEGYAMEELVAELGSAFLSADLGLTPEVRDDHAAYLAGWLKVLKEDKRAIFSAAAHAQRAAEFLHGLQPSPAPDVTNKATYETLEL